MVPDHGKTGLREFRACIHDLSGGILRLNCSIAHFRHARKIELDTEELQRLEAVLKNDVLGGLVVCMERGIGKEDKN